MTELRSERLAHPPRRRLGETVFGHLQRAIKSGAYAADERLPPEHALAAEFEVSRPVIRDALRRLREKGLIYSRQGAGSFVRVTGVREPLGFGELENLSDLADCYDFRITVEPAAAARAALAHTDAALADVEHALANMREATHTSRHREDADFAFHLAIARASGNPYYATAMASLETHIAIGMQLHGQSLKAQADGLGHVFGEHVAIYDAIARGDADTASALMRGHLERSRARLFEAQRNDAAPLGGPAIAG